MASRPLPRGERELIIRLHEVGVAQHDRGTALTHAALAALCAGPALRHRRIAIACRPAPRRRVSMYEIFYWPTPNGKKVTILLEECGLEYKITPVNIQKGDQFNKDFLRMNPNHRMPVMVDHKPKDGGAPDQRVRVRRHHDVHRREGRQVLAAGYAHQVRGHRVGDLADGQPGPEARRGRAFPPPRRPRGRSEVRRQPLHRRGQPPLRRAQQPAGRPRTGSPARSTRSPT